MKQITSRRRYESEKLYEKRSLSPIHFPLFWLFCELNLAAMEAILFSPSAGGLKKAGSCVAFPIGAGLD